MRKIVVLWMLMLGICSESYAQSITDLGIIKIEQFNKNYIAVTSPNRIRFVVSVLNSKKDKAYYLEKGQRIYIKNKKLTPQSTLMIRLEQDDYLDAKNNTISEYDSDVMWTMLMLALTEREYDIFPGIDFIITARADGNLAKIRKRLQQRSTNRKKRAIYEKFGQKMEIAAAKLYFLKHFYRACEGEDTPLSYMLEPINIFDNLEKRKE